MVLNCILCGAKSSEFFKDENSAASHATPGFEYFQCSNCELIFVNPAQHLDSAQEKERYLLHVNDPQDEGYRNYLDPAADAIKNLLSVRPSLKTQNSSAQNFKVLDYGCGPSSALEGLLQNLPVQYESYDLYFKDDKKVLSERYDIVVATEVIEHLKNPEQTIKQLKDLIKSDGHLVFMTQFYFSKTDFKNWHYRRDATHVAFYTHKTMQFIKERFNFSSIEFTSERVVAFRN